LLKVAGRGAIGQLSSQC